MFSTWSFHILGVLFSSLSASGRLGPDLVQESPVTGLVTENGHILGVPGHRADVGLAAALGRLQQGEGGEGEQAQGILGGRFSYSRDDETFHTI